LNPIIQLTYFENEGLGEFQNNQISLLKQFIKRRGLEEFKIHSKILLCEEANDIENKDQIHQSFIIDHLAIHSLIIDRQFNLLMHPINDLSLILVI